MANTLRASRSGYYQWIKRGCISQREIRDMKDIVIVEKAFYERRETYGAKRLSKHLKNPGHFLEYARVKRLMQEHSLIPKTVRKFRATTNSNHDFPAAPNLLNQNFDVGERNTVWVCDITYVATQEGWLYLAAVLDLCNGKLVGWAMDKQMTSKLTCAALRQAYSAPIQCVG